MTSKSLPVETVKALMCRPMVRRPASSVMPVGEAAGVDGELLLDLIVARRAGDCVPTWITPPERDGIEGDRVGPGDGFGEIDRFAESQAAVGDIAVVAIAEVVDDELAAERDEAEVGAPGGVVGVVDEAIAGGVARGERRDGRAETLSPDGVVGSVDAAVGVEVAGRGGERGLGFVGAHVESADEAVVRRATLVGLVGWRQRTLGSPALRAGLEGRTA